MLRIRAKLAVGLAAGLVVGGLLMFLNLRHGLSATVMPQSSPNLDLAVDGPAPVLSYQGRLLNPSTGEPKTDGAYAMVFALYNVVEGGSPLWSETDSVNVKGGQFTTLLGDQTPLDGTVLNGQDLWLGVAVGSDPEAAPRLRVAHAAYAVYAVQAGYAGDANALDGNDSAAFAPSSHNHPGEQITSGTVADARIDGSITRDGEVMAIVQANDGAGSGVDADTVDGNDSAAFAPSSHNHPGEQITSGTVADARIDGSITRDGEVMTIVKANDGAGSGVDADTVDGQQASAFAGAGHGHFEGYWTGSNTTYGLIVSNSSTGDGIRAYSASTNNGFAAVWAINTASGPGIYADSNGGQAGYFDGPVYVSGALTKAGGGFKIDHPLDPENKYLYHSFVESPDMKNVYDGVATLDASGEVWVELPDWFQALNRDFRYQLTAIGAPGPNLYIASEVENNRFRIAGGAPGMRVSWQVTGIRHDPYAEANRIPVEQDKPAEQLGTYLHPAEYGEPDSKGASYAAMSSQEAATEKLENATGEVK